ncbi:MAG TPA: hypothetical protein VK811_06910 [Candidatus Acidoferrum sp.]|jgi:hypothetical protein|nr:hypothetical protein [Candidatus Acidoferrum sp.]
MKSFMILWAIVAFLLGIGLSLENNCAWPTAFWRGCAAALVAAILARWWGNVWLDGLRDSIRQRQFKRAIPVAKPKSPSKT